MDFKELLLLEQQVHDARAELNGPPEEFAERQSRLHASEHLPEALEAQLGGSITPLACDSDLQKPGVLKSMVFLLEDTYVLYYNAFPIYDGYDMWAVYVPSFNKVTDGKPNIAIENHSLMNDFTNGRKLDTPKPLQRTYVVDRIDALQRRGSLVPASQRFNRVSYADLVVAKLAGTLRRPLYDLRPSKMYEEIGERQVRVL